VTARDAVTSAAEDGGAPLVWRSRTLVDRRRLAGWQSAVSAL
jgi:hypothetical protein